MTKLDRIILENDELKQRLIDSLSETVDKTNESLYTRLENLSLSLSSKKGILSLDETSKKFLSSLETIITNELSNSGYNSEITKFTRSFNLVDDNVVIMHKVANNIDIDLKKLTDIQQGEIANTITRLRGNNINANFTNPIKEILYRHIASGGTLTDGKQILRTFIKGDKQNLGRLKRYVIQVATDSIGQYEGAMQQKIADEYELNAIKYVGSIITESRPQCIRWTKMEYILMKDLQKEIIWANTNGTGMIKGTTPQTFVIYRGGYNCRHTALPIFVDENKINL